MSDTYHPCLSECYGCYETLVDGDMIISFFEHYLHVGCAPVHVLETAGRPFEYKTPVFT